MLQIISDLATGTRMSDLNSIDADYLTSQEVYEQVAPRLAALSIQRPFFPVILLRNLQCVVAASHTEPGWLCQLQALHLQKTISKFKEPGEGK